MRSRFVLLLLVGAAVSSLASPDQEHGWKVGHEYRYLVRSRTLTALNGLSKDYTGILMKAILQIQCNSPNMLRAQLLTPQYAQIHKELKDGWETHITDHMLKYEDLPMSKRPFVIKMKHGTVRDLIMDKNVPTWEVNIIKSIVSQLQADTQGENGRRTKDMQIPHDKNPFAMFHVMEDSVGGKCEVLYDITPLPDYVLQDHPELVPKPELKGSGEHMYIMKTKNYEKCEERVDYHFGISGNVNWDSHRKNNRNFMTKSSISSIVISGGLKSFSIQSSVTKNQIIVKPRLMDEQDSVVMNKMNLTLAAISKVSVPIPAPSNPESTGNLVYTYNKPFSPNQHRRSRRPSMSPNSNSIEFNDGSAWTDSDQNSGDMLDSDEDTTIWQPKPTLEEAPENPLLPLFIGNKGKAVLLSDKIVASKNVRRLVDEISNELDEPNTIPDNDTLEKFTILSRLLGSMSYAQIKEIEADLNAFLNEIESDEKNQARKETARAVFRDAIADAGTGPALLIIRDWIEKRTIKKNDATMVVSRLPKTARMPTIQYMDTFFALASNPDVQYDIYLGSSAILSFAELVYLAQVSNSSIHNNYPVHSFGRPSSRNNDVVTTKYIPYMEEQLRKAIKDGDSPRIQVYIMALGYTGHPKILSVFEPYLEGRQQVSTFQRLLMVACLGKLAEHRPELTRAVLYKIYLNTWEAHQVRCAAVFILMKMKPPLDMILRMAKFTNYDYNVHVISAVKSAINQAAEMENSGWQEYAKQAKDYLSPEPLGFPYSESTITETKLNSRDLAYKIIFDYIGSDDSFLPSSWYLSLQSTYGKFVAPTEEAGFMISSIKNLMEMYWQNKAAKKGNKATYVEQIAKILNIESDYPEQVEGNYFVNTKYMNHFFAFDNHTIEQIPKVFGELLKSMEKGHRINANTLMSYDINLSYPTETGLPFVYSLRIPSLQKVSVTSKGADVDFRILMATKVQGRVGFVTPFDQQHYVSGIDMKAQAFIPGKVAITSHTSKDTIEVEINLRASRPDENIRMFHLSIVPYTSHHSVLSLRPVLLEKNTQIISDPEQVRRRIPPKGIESVFVLEMSSADLLNDIDSWTQHDDLTDWLMFPLSLGRGALEKIDFYLKATSDGDKAIIFRGLFQTKNIGINPSQPDDNAWQHGSKAPIVESHKLDSGVRRSNFLRDVAVGMNSGDAYVIDAALELPGTWDSHYVFTMALAQSEPEGKYRSLFYWHLDIPVFEVKAEMCANAQIKHKATPPFDFERILDSSPMEEIEMHVRFGEKCSTGEEITVTGNFTQSEDYKQYVREMNPATSCKKKTMNGMPSLDNCDKAVEWSNCVDELRLSIDSDSPKLHYAMEKAVDAWKKSLQTKNSIVTSVGSNMLDNGDNLSLHVRVSPDFKKLSGIVYRGEKMMHFGDVDLDEFGIESTDIEDLQSDGGMEVVGLCTITKNEAMTFDGRTYPVKLGNCPHVLTTTYPKRDPTDHNKMWNIPDDKKMTVIARDVENDKKEVTVVLGEDKIIMKPSDSQLKVTVNGNEIDCTRGKIYQKINDEDETVYNIFEMPGPAIRLTSDEYDIQMVYDGERVRVKVSTDYQKSVRGLCGDFDYQMENDFITPQNCILKKPEEFAATYALKDQCDGETLKLAKMAETSPCAKQKIRLSDVISDEEAGRSTKNWQQWGYHKKITSKQCNSYRTKIIPKDDKICFTTRPVPMCSEGCVPVETKQKKYQLHCMEKNSNTLGMKRRIEQGANPDLSHLSSSAIEIMSVPLECRAA